MFSFSKTFFILSFIFNTGLWGNQTASALEPLPNAPTYYVFDNSKIISDKARRALEALVIEHDRLTGEQFMIAIFPSEDGQNSKEISEQVFSHWKIGKRGQNNGILLSLFSPSQEVHITLGYGLENVLTPDKTKEIVHDTIDPKLQDKQIDEALVLGTYQILDLLQSPLVQSGKADEIIKSLKFNEPSALSEEIPSSSISILLFVGSIALMLVTLHEILAREAHFTRSGWFRPSVFRSLTQFHKKPSNISGGISGSWS